MRRVTREGKRERVFLHRKRKFCVVYIFMKTKKMRSFFINIKFHVDVFVQCQELNVQFIYQQFLEILYGEQKRRVIKAEYIRCLETGSQDFMRRILHIFKKFLIVKSC